MQKKFLKNLAFLLFLNLLVKPFWILGIDREVQNVVGPEEFGFYFTVLNFSFLFYIFLDLGITSFNNRNIAQNNQLLNKHLAGIGSLKLLLGLVYGVVIFLVALIIGYEGRQLYLLGWVGFNQFLLSFIMYLRSNVSGLLLFKTESFLSVLDRLIMIVLCATLIWTPFLSGNITIEHFVYAQTLAYLLTASIALIAVLNKSGHLRLNWNLAFFVMIIKKSLPFALLVLLMSFYNRIDPVLIERLIPGTRGDQQSGVYAQAFRLLDAGQNFALLFAVLLLPLFASMLKRKESVEQLVKLSFSIIISGALIIAISSQFYAKELMQLMYYRFETESVQAFATRMDEATGIFRLLMFSFVGISANYIFGTLLTANNNLKKLNIIACSGLVINLLLNFVLIPDFEALGSAYASLATQSFTAIAQVLLAVRLFQFRINYSLIGRILLTIVLLFAVGFGLQSVTQLSWYISMGLMVFSGLMITLILKLLNIREFIAILKM